MMTSRRSSLMEGTDAKATLHVQNKPAQKTGAEDDVEKLIAFASTILVGPTESGGGSFNEE